MINITRLHRLRAALERCWTEHKVLHGRRRLLERPWLEDVLHWSADGQLHGQITPRATGGPASVTSDGWCPGARCPEG